MRVFQAGITIAACGLIGAQAEAIATALRTPTQQHRPAGIPATASDDETEPATRPPMFGRVRSTNARIRGIVEEGYKRSPTFRGLVDRLEHSAVLVYIEAGRCRPTDVQRLTGCLADLGDPGGVRHLRIVVDIALAGANLIGTVGHELQHAVEACESISDPHGRREEIVAAGARRVRAHVYETDKARQAKEAILEDLRRASQIVPVRPAAASTVWWRLTPGAPVRPRPSP